MLFKILDSCVIQISLVLDCYFLALPIGLVVKLANNKRYFFLLFTQNLRMTLHVTVQFTLGQKIKYVCFGFPDRI